MGKRGQDERHETKSTRKSKFEGIEGGKVVAGSLVSQSERKEKQKEGKNSSSLWNSLICSPFPFDTRQGQLSATDCTSTTRRRGQKKKEKEEEDGDGMQWHS